MNNDQEWRNLLLSEIKELKDDVKLIRNEMTTLKVKVASFSVFIGAIVHAIFNGFHK
jgi:hypothetical protein